MRIRALVLAVLAGTAATVLVPPSPARAVDCVETFVIDPTLCDPSPYPYPPYPPDPEPVVFEEISDVELVTVTERLMGDGPACARVEFLTATNGILTDGTRLRLYEFGLNARFCVGLDVGGLTNLFSVTVTPVRSVAFGRAGVTVTRNRRVLGPTGVGTSRSIVVEELFLQICNSAGGNCTNRRHFVQLTIDPRTATTASELTLFSGELPPVDV